VPNVPWAQKSFWIYPIELQGEVGHVEPRFGLFRDSVSIGAKIGSRFAPYIPQAQKSFWMHTTELLGDLGHVESRFCLFTNSANLGTRLVQGLRRTYHRHINHCGRT
jgi:hypothetical protein